MADMLQMQEQSRKSFFQWHVLLVMKKKQLQKTLSEAGVRPEEVRQIEQSLPPVVDSDELALLQRFGLPIPPDLVGFAVGHSFFVLHPPLIMRTILSSILCDNLSMEAMNGAS